MQRSILHLVLIACLSFAPVALFAAPTKTPISHIDDGNPTKLKLAIGSKKGVTVGTTGYLADSSGKKVEGTDFKVISVEEKACIVVVNIDSTKLDGAWSAFINLP